MSTIVIAPDSFKGSASAAQVAGALAQGWRDVRPDDTLLVVPLADGGEGTLDAFALAIAHARRMPLTVTGPDDRPVRAHWLLLPDGTGVVEIASTSGITLQERLSPMSAHTAGFGQALAAALDHGVRRLLIALGGSASTDGGVAALSALGARFLDADGQDIGPGGSGLRALTRVDLDHLRPLPPDGAAILGDVTNPLLGPDGAAHVFGPQKGANAAEVDALEGALTRLVTAIPPGRRPSPQARGAGAAGGAAYGLMLWGATMSGGADAVGDALGVPGLIAAADLVITGEGCFDSQSMAGKVPSYIAGLAAQSGVPAALVAGSIQAPTEGFTRILSLTELAGSGDAARRTPLPWLRAAGMALAQSTPS